MTEAEAEVGAALELSGLPPHIPDELLTLYFENRRRSGGGPVLSWQRLGCGGVLTFCEPADAERVLAQEEHKLQGTRLSLRPAPPRAPARLLLQGLPPGTTPQRLEQHVQALLRATGHPELPCRALASPRPDRALVQLPKPLSEAEVCALEEQARTLGLDGHEVSVMRVPQARAVRVLRDPSPVDLLLLELYLENEPRSAGGPLDGLRSLPGDLGVVGSFQQWQVAERVLRQEHWLQGSELSLVPHYDVLEPERLDDNTSGRDDSAGSGPGATEHAVPEAGGPARTTMGAGPVTVSPEKAPGQSRASLRTSPIRSLEQDGPVSSGPMGSLGQEGPVEMVLSMEPGAMRFIQLHHEDLLAGLGDVALSPLEGSDVAGFRLCGALAPCQAAEEFLQSLLGSVSCHVLSLEHPGSARFLLGPQGQHLLQGLEARFRCAFGTERLAGEALDVDPEEVDPIEALPALPGQLPPGSDQENLSLEKVRELLATLEGVDGEDWSPLELGEEDPTEEEPAPSTEALGQLEEEAALQLALHQSLQPQASLAEQEAIALQQALALSLLDPSPLGAEEPLGEAAGQAQLVVHAAYDQDRDELDRAVAAALEHHLREETVGLQGHVLPEELRARLERRHSVSVALEGDCAVLRGFGAQPSRAARHLSSLLAGPLDRSMALVLEASSPALSQQRLKGSLGRLDRLDESSREFQEVVQAFYDTLDTVHSRVHIVRVERVLHPLLLQQYELQRERLEQRCERRPMEHVLYHGTTAAAVAEICAYGFNRSFCGRNGTHYGKGVYFAKSASLSVQDRYSPPNAEGHKSVFVVRVLTGDYGQGRKGLRAPPLRAPGHALLRYDSAVDCLQRPSIFVIFHDTQALPTHLITCEHTPGAPPRDPYGLLGDEPVT